MVKKKKIQWLDQIRISNNLVLKIFSENVVNIVLLEKKKLLVLIFQNNYVGKLLLVLN